MALSRYISGDFITPAMRQCWEQGIPYKIMRPFQQIQDLPPNIPFGGKDAPQKRTEALGVVRNIQAQLGMSWNDSSDAEPTFHRVDPISYESLTRDASRLDKEPSILGNVLGRQAYSSQIAHGTIFIPPNFDEMMESDFCVIGSLPRLEVELASNKWSSQAKSAKQTLQNAINDAKRLRLPLIIDK